MGLNRQSTMNDGSEPAACLRRAVHDAAESAARQASADPRRASSNIRYFAFRPRIVHSDATAAHCRPNVGTSLELRGPPCDCVALIHPMSSIRKPCLGSPCVL